MHTICAEHTNNDNCDNKHGKYKTLDFDCMKSYKSARWHTHTQTKNWVWQISDAHCVSEKTKKTHHVIYIYITVKWQSLQWYADTHNAITKGQTDEKKETKFQVEE